MRSKKIDRSLHQLRNEASPTPTQMHQFLIATNDNETLFRKYVPLTDTFCLPNDSPRQDTR